MYIIVSYEEKDLKYTWRSEVESAIFIYDNEMAQFDIVSAKRYLKHKVYHSGKVNQFLIINNTLGRCAKFVFLMYILELACEM